jgi:hypothetical protein
VEFLQEDATGNIIWPKNWAQDCLPPPYLYFIREKVWPELDPDALEQNAYRGKTLVVVDNVSEEVTERVLMAWLNAGLDDDDPDLVSAKIQLQEMRDNLAKVEKQISELPALKAQGANAKEELELKKKRAQALNMQKLDLEEDIRALTEKFDKLRRDRESMVSLAFQVKLAEVKQPLGLGVWEVRFSKDKKGQRNAYIAVHKFNWSEFRVAYHRYTGEVIAGKNELPGLTPEFQEVNMRNVTVSRRKHGIGMHKFSDERGFYSGHWRHGLRHGVGTEINQQGRFQGNFDRDWRRGPGSHVFSNGDSYRGPYGYSRHHLRESLIFGDEYSDGMAHGRGKLRFVDGSLYDGEWKDGVPTGKGKYVSSTGVVMEGTFGRWATLHGYGSSTVDDVTRIGLWREGLMHGPGTEIDMQTGTYEGDWANGEKHGYGVLASKLVGGTHEGWYHFGYRWGRGVLNYGNVDRDREAAEERMKKIAESMRSKRLGLGVEAGAGKEGGGGEGGGDEEDGGAAQLAREFGEMQAEEAERMAALAPGAGRGSGREWADTAAAAAAPPPMGANGSMADTGAGATSLTTTTEQNLANAMASLAAADSARQSEYEKMQGEPVQFIPFRGDYSYEGRWRAGCVRTGGVFTRRFGRPEPNLHTLTFTHNGKNPDFPLLVDLAAREEEVMRKRATFAKETLKETIDKRLIKEAENLSSYVYWKRAAELNQKEIRRRTRRGKKQLEEIKAGIKKPERTLGMGGEEEEKDDYSDESEENSEEEDEGREAKNEEQEFAV